LANEPCPAAVVIAVIVIWAVAAHGREFRDASV
jgi:hypothetical protein